jgi:hypothetical protein
MKTRGNSRKAGRKSRGLLWGAGCCVTVLFVLLAYQVMATGEGSGRTVDDEGDAAGPDPVSPAAKAVAKESRERETVSYDRVLPDAAQRTFAMSVLAENLVSPDGVAIHPRTGEVYVSEDDAWAISRVRDGQVERVIDRDTPVFAGESAARVRAGALQFPEGIAFAPNGDLYVAEDIPGGRLLCFPMDNSGAYAEGESVPLPGDWADFAWEGLDVSATGEILLAGADLEAVAASGSMGVFTGVILYRDVDGVWWIPHRRFFASYSSATFSKSGRQILYTCEVTGQIGWVELRRTSKFSGHSDLVARSPEGLAVLPDGTLLIAEEQGSIVHLDPASDRYQRICTDMESIESVLWDPLREQILITEDGTGRLLACTPDTLFDPSLDRLAYATYYPAFSEQHVPDVCPDYLTKILALGGLDFETPGRAPLSFREFVSRMPLIAADVKTVLMGAAQAVADPVERIQFVIFEPNRMGMPTEGESGQAFALFAVQMRSGEIVHTTSLSAMASTARAPDPRVTPRGMVQLTVPMPAAVSISDAGVAAVQFTGLGRTADFSLVLNPHNPADSYMVVFQPDGSRDHYRLEAEEAMARRQWVIAYRPAMQDAWVRVSPTEESLASAGGLALAGAGRRP